MKELPEELSESLCFVSCCVEALGVHDYPCWLPQRDVSLALFGANGKHTVEQIEQSTGCFVWATEFSNVHTTFTFEEPSINIDGVTYNGGPEQYYQLAKSIGTKDEETARHTILHSRKPINSYIYGNRFALRSDWDSVKEDIMRVAVHAKFTQHESLKTLLLSTKNFPLVQIKPGDAFWGTGPDGKGRNA
eukprot:CAMPEP_0206184804 /NCGR_PEP_ID=MMETSP0166-20121206/1431_1 /ASSEMBLY_ACC=CAM_ASM_000260 /TAXON_ID=95228 /ORGANISM="Vannella robusta, Strain DIVA3 518/3/11/1/6" /LENGTH=189 /DNA_ID=CAMNT_0053599879 /DNA_START=497 /DNA_END=1063 /DNA_ORIENTATION=-